MKKGAVYSHGPEFDFNSKLTIEQMRRVLPAVRAGSDPKLVVRRTDGHSEDEYCPLCVGMDGYDVCRYLKVSPMRPIGGSDVGA